MRECAILLEVNASFLVIFVKLWNEELLQHVQIHDTHNGHLVPQKLHPCISFLWGIVNHNYPRYNSVCFAAL
jgi:hypothetical protein